MALRRHPERDPIDEAAGLQMMGRSRRLTVTDEKEVLFRAEVLNRVFKQELRQLDSMIKKLEKAIKNPSKIDSYDIEVLLEQPSHRRQLTADSPTLTDFKPLLDQPKGRSVGSYVDHRPTNVHKSLQTNREQRRGATQVIWHVKRAVSFSDDLVDKRSGVIIDTVSMTSLSGRSNVTEWSDSESDDLVQSHSAQAQKENTTTEQNGVTQRTDERKAELETPLCTLSTYEKECGKVKHTALPAD
ncbi:hypothetical protein Bbelb_269050 [Branchiostoma belcheri]|nr:hypothetical protein Bbelb_269050 [Branchiostoma belcheri]